jgi:hypothetical protein
LACFRQIESIEEKRKRFNQERESKECGLEVVSITKSKFAMIELGLVENACHSQTLYLAYFNKTYSMS